MECIEARALKSSMLSQMVMRTNSQKNDDVWCLNGINSIGTDDFVVEDLLNLDFPEIELQEENNLFREGDDEKVSPKRNSESSSFIFSGTEEFENISAGELNIPVDDLENLEWLSHFVDDSTSGVSLLSPTAAGNFWGKTAGASANRVEPVRRPAQRIRTPYFPLPVPRKSRSKRSRSNGRSWSLESPPLSTTESSSTSDSSTISPFLFTNRIQDWFSCDEKLPAKKLKIKPESDGGFMSGRRCMHCQVQKTPQWRTGPMGPKTLCNACGVRFKSGRLFPEYRPACSPTFSQEVHSNSHRKVLEMRRKKETGGVVESSLSRVVQSF